METSQPSITDQMLKRRVVDLVGEINGKSISHAMEGLLRLQLESSEPAYLFIDSGGGALYPALQLVDAIENLFTMEVYGVVHGRCMSAATFVLLACKKRFSTLHSRFLIHNGTTSGIALKNDDLTKEKLEQLQKEIAENMRVVLRLYTEKLKKPEEEVRKYLARGEQQFNDELSAEEALEIGLVTEIVEGKLPFFSNTSAAT